jgi:hypothetical protein
MNGYYLGGHPEPAIIDTSNRQLTEPAETLTAGERRFSRRHEQRLGRRESAANPCTRRLGWVLSRIQEATGAAARRSTPSARPQGSPCGVAAIRANQNQNQAFSSRHAEAVPAAAVAIEEGARQIHPPERRNGKHIGLRAGAIIFSAGARRVIRQRCVQRVVLCQIQVRAAVQNRSISGPVPPMSLACLPVTSSPIVGPPFRPSVRACRSAPASSSTRRCRRRSPEAVCRDKGCRRRDAAASPR